jgi:hypothetical protein
MPPSTSPVNNLTEQISWLLRERPFIPPPPRNVSSNDQLAHNIPLNSIEIQPLQCTNASGTTSGLETVGGAVPRQQSRVADNSTTSGRLTQARSGDGQGGNIATTASGSQDMAQLKLPLVPSLKPQCITRTSETSVRAGKAPRGLV